MWHIKETNWSLLGYRHWRQAAQLHSFKGNFSFINSFWNKKKDSQLANKVRKNWKNGEKMTLWYCHKWAPSSEFGTYRLCEQRRFRRACSSAQSRQNLCCSLIQAVSQEESSDRKPDPWPLWMAGHAQLKFVMMESSKTQIRLTGLKYSFLIRTRNISGVVFFVIGTCCTIGTISKISFKILT